MTSEAWGQNTDSVYEKQPAHLFIRTMPYSHLQKIKVPDTGAVLKLYIVKKY